MARARGPGVRLLLSAAAALMLVAGGFWAASAGGSGVPYRGAVPQAAAGRRHPVTGRFPTPATPAPTPGAPSPTAPPQGPGASASAPARPAPSTRAVVAGNRRAGAGGSGSPVLLALALLDGRPVAASTLAVDARHLTATPLPLRGASARRSPGPNLANAYASGGLKRAEAAAGRAIGQPVPYGLTFDMGALPAVVDDVGGLRYDLPRPVDAGSGASAVHLPAGEQRLNGADTLALLRLCLQSPRSAGAVCGSGQLVRTLGRRLMQPPPTAIPALLLDLGPAVHSDMAMPALIHLALTVMHGDLALEVHRTGAG